ncbi:anti-sigma F factor antagonist [Anaerocolumna aminovalerica]|jgi:stage II sporulation protein AA (anti-sigma F factor antagonist)|uniref:Anti-sigma F factor antagonist n=1 Tax=Anaerocolumna aminovalerica TaxID=1527 RepID=A0A1I5HW97_9FIRM|nr:anti-sigma F factor antagonist [Anaerocolumna aminovalerica]MBU5331081.1 anti-sigma F factor antagonist [Anaerocolumna aminovalerica]MDU6263508.1 anti-sigma F factor antagonist [Anaerocolumna aminovalerica]SFO52061.1 anti-anti-sigma regulatory factor, SpoIIAA [Anaerocolumna aminovalerica]
MEKKEKKPKNTSIYQLREGVKADFEIVNKCLIIKLMEELDHHNALTIREQSDKLISGKNIKDIVFDFTGSDFMDSSGIGVIMGRYKKIIFTGGKVAVTGVNQSVDRIFRLSGLYKIIHKFNTIEDAVKEFNK